jgi:hypothetical protein
VRTSAVCIVLRHKLQEFFWDSITGEEVVISILVENPAEV